MRAASPWSTIKGEIQNWTDCATRKIERRQAVLGISCPYKWISMSSKNGALPFVVPGERSN